MKKKKKKKKNNLLPFLNDRWKAAMAEWSDEDVGCFLEIWPYKLYNFSRDDNIALMDSMMEYYKKLNSRDCILDFNGYRCYKMLKEQYLAGNSSVG